MEFLTYAFFFVLLFAIVVILRRGSSVGNTFSMDALPEKRLLAGVGVSFGGFLPHALEMNKQLRCRSCPAEDACGKWRVGEGESEFCPYERSFGVS